jgi:hypothetical protein
MKQIIDLTRSSNLKVKAKAQIAQKSFNESYPTREANVPRSIRRQAAKTD